MNSRARSDSSDRPSSPSPSSPDPTTAESLTAAPDPLGVTMFAEMPETTTGPELPADADLGPREQDAAGRVELGDSPRPGTDRQTLRRKARELVPVIAGAVATVGGIVHQLLTREDTPEREAGMWLPDEEDVAAISEPAAGLASRRMPEGANNPDVTDLAQLVFGVAGYAMKQYAKAQEIARAQVLEDTVEDYADAGGARV